MCLKKAGSEKLKKPSANMYLHPYMISSNQLRVTAALILAFLFMLSCAPNSNSQAGIATSSVPFLVMQKTPCYGPCPAYEATIMENGNITFVGWRNLPIHDNDTVQLSLTQNELKLLRADIAALNYPSLQTVYSSEWTDSPSTYLTFYQDGKEAKKIKHQTGGPDALLKFMENLDKKLMTMLEQKVKQR